MTTTQFSIFVALILGTVAVFGGLGQMIIVLLLGVVGLVVGRILEGKLDLRDITGQSSDKV